MILKTYNSLFLIISILLVSILDLNAKQNSNSFTDTIKNYDALEFRSIGPALMSGRISDIVINPNNENEWIVATGSGGVWKTTNAGTTWNPIFDNEKSFSIGCVTLDPNNPNIIWVGTGENVGGRHVGIGHGIYQSTDGGKTWKNKGLKKLIINNLKKKITYQDIGFNIGPLINSSGRIAKANDVVELFLTQNDDKIDKILNKMYAHNVTRKKIEQENLDLIDFKKYYSKNVIFIYNKNFSLF